MNKQNLDFSFLNEKTNNIKNKWDFSKIYDANILQVKEKMEKKDFLSLKASKNTLKGKTRNFLRDKLYSLFSSFLSNNFDKELKLKQSQQIKMIIENFVPAKKSEFLKVFDYLQSLEKTSAKK